MFTKIVVGVDGSETAQRALSIACDLARKYDGEIHLVHTPEPHTVAFALGAVAGYHAVTTMPPPGDVKAASRKVLDSSVKTAGEFGVKVASVHDDIGEPAEKIIKCAADSGADLIVTGRRGLGALGAMVQGSTTQKINRQAESACLSVV